MSSLTLQPMPLVPPVRVAVVVSRYNGWITDKLRDGAIEELARKLGDSALAVVMPVPGSFELPSVARAAAASGKFQAVVALGCVIKGETKHDEYISIAVANEIARAGADTGVPVLFGVLTVNSPEQAEARAGGVMGNKGAEAMAAALETAGVLMALRKWAPSSM